MEACVTRIVTRCCSPRVWVSASCVMLYGRVRDCVSALRLAAVKWRVGCACYHCVSGLFIVLFVSLLCFFGLCSWSVPHLLGGSHHVLLCLPFFLSFCVTVLRSFLELIHDHSISYLYVSASPKVSHKRVFTLIG